MFCFGQNVFQCLCHPSPTPIGDQEKRKLPIVDDFCDPDFLTLPLLIIFLALKANQRSRVFPSQKEIIEKSRKGLWRPLPPWFQESVIERDGQAPGTHSLLYQRRELRKEIEVQKHVVLLKKFLRFMFTCIKTFASMKDQMANLNKIRD